MSVRLAAIATFWGLICGLLAGMVIGAEHLSAVYIKIGTEKDPKLAYLDRKLGPEWVRLGDPDALYHIAIKESDRRYILVDDDNNEISPVLGLGNPIWVRKKVQVQ
jgi:hypothetical protein